MIHYNEKYLSFCFFRLRKKIKKLDIKKNDSIFLSTNIGSVGIPKSKNKNYLLTTSKWLLEILKSKIGTKGNTFLCQHTHTHLQKKEKYLI